MSIRRTQAPITAKKLADETLFSALDWPEKTVRLERDTLQDYLQRSSSPQVSVAELYHENSKLFPAMVQELAAARVEVARVCEEYLERRAAVVRNWPKAAVESPWSEFFAQITRTVPQTLFYAIELRLALGDLLLLFEPLAVTIHPIKKFSLAEQTTLRNSMRILVPSKHPGEIGPILFLVGSLARSQLLYGARGYRNCLIEAGRMAEAACQAAASLGQGSRLCLEFADRAIDRLVEADGVEESVLAALELGVQSHVR